jgi:hypothetical protein
MAAPLKPEQIEEKKTLIVKAMSSGTSFRQSAFAVGVTESTVFLWRKADAMFDEAIKAVQMKTGRVASGTRVAHARKAVDVPTETVPTIIDEVCQAIRAGLPLDYCCLLANVQRGALKQWMIEDESIAAAVNRAQAQNLLWWISKLRQGADKDWRAALAYLERIYPNLFAEVKAVDINVRQEEKSHNAIIDVTPDSLVQKLMGMTDEELEQIAKANI